MAKLLNGHNASWNKSVYPKYYRMNTCYFKELYMYLQVNLINVATAY